MTATTGAVLRQARSVRGLSLVEAARAATISAAYLSRLEGDAVKKPSPHVLHQLSEALAVPYADLMRLNAGAQTPQHITSLAMDALNLADSVDTALYVSDELGRNTGTRPASRSAAR